MPGAEPAATVLALRPVGEGFEVLVVHRNSHGYFGDIVVFPGGKVDEVDIPPGRSRQDELAHRNAAVREFAEETGILITDQGPKTAPKLKGGELYEWIKTSSLVPGVEELVLVSRWVTPEFVPRRFDTRFYVVACADPPEVNIDSDELIWHEWVTPGLALERFETGVWPMMRPTTAHLRWLQRWSSIDEAIRSAEGADGRTVVIPRRVGDGSLLPVHMPAEHQ